MRRGVAHKSKGWIAQDDIALPPQTPKRGVSSESEACKSNVHDYFELQYKKYRLVTTIKSTSGRANLFKKLK
jgi:hypothetical protein